MRNSKIIMTGLYDNYLRAQDAMDEYVISVCDSQIINPLRTQRDAAKEAYMNFCKQHNIKGEL